MELEMLEDGMDIYRLIEKYVKLPMEEEWTYNTTWESIIFPEGYEKPPRDKFEEDLRNLVEKKYWKSIREERNKRISACDWTQLPNVPLPGAKKYEWETYRQALRDITQTTEDPRNPVWPIKPSP
tara:strand:+ start:180 stop:554 length:375 start_codon:yes stop_codon:yes gene_type:complete